MRMRETAGQKCERRDKFDWIILVFVSLFSSVKFRRQKMLKSKKGTHLDTFEMIS